MDLSSNKVVGKYFNQPLDQTLVDFRLIWVIAIVITGVWCDNLFWHILELKKVSVEYAGVLWGQFLLLVSIFWKAIQEMRQPYNNNNNIG